MTEPHHVESEVNLPLRGFLAEVKKRADDAYISKSKSFENKSLNDIFDEQIKVTEQHFKDQILRYREGFFIYLLVLMALETITLFSIVILSSVASKKILVINDTTLQILVGATIAQISTMLIVIIKSVYSDNLLELYSKEYQNKRK